MDGREVQGEPFKHLERLGDRPCCLAFEDSIQVLNESPTESKMSSDWEWLGPPVNGPEGEIFNQE